MRTDTGLVRSESLDSLITLVVVFPELGGCDIAFELPPDERSDKDRDDPSGEVEGLPRVEVGIGGVTASRSAKQETFVEGCTYNPYDTKAATMVAAELVMNHAHTRRGCSDRRYHWAVSMEKSGMLAASKRPNKNRVAMSPP